MAAGAIPCESRGDSGTAFDGVLIEPLLAAAPLIAQHGNEQVGDARRAHVAKRGELLAIDAIEQQDAAAEHLALVNRLERPCCGDLLGMHHHFQIARLEFFHAATRVRCGRG